ncbi:MAG: hypothetical protein WBW01_02780, partial [Terriglobales bacterium]
VIGNLVESLGPFSSVGDSCEIVNSTGERFAGEIVAFRGAKVLSMCLEKPHGICFGDRVVTCGEKPSLRVGPELLGRVIDATGEPLDSLGEYRAEALRLASAWTALAIAASSQYWSVANKTKRESDLMHDYGGN